MTFGSGVVIPFGDIDGTRGTLASRAAWLVPFTIGIGYSTGRLYFGGYSEGALGLSKGGEPECAPKGCVSSQFRVGVESTYTFGAGSVAPWVGYGIGLEAAHEQIGSEASRSHATPVELSATYVGIELAHTTVGIDIRSSRTLILTPFVGASFGTYFSWSKFVRATQEDDGGAIDQRAWHGAILLGLRVGGFA